MTQAVALNQILCRNGHQVVGVLVGKNPNRSLPAFFQNAFETPVIPIRSPSFTFKAGKGVDLFATATNLIQALGEYRRSLKLLNKTIEETRPDLIINFLEPLTGLYKLTHRHSVPVLSIGHQFMMEHPKSFRVGRMGLQHFLMRQYVRLVGARSTKAALSFAKEADMPDRNLFVCPPLLRRQLFELKSDSSGSFLLLYLVNPGYAEEVIRWHQANPSIEIHCFYDKAGAPAQDRYDDRLTFHAVDGEKFLKYMARCRAVACTAGFESVCEAAYLGKPVLLVPLANHVEQSMNALESEQRGFGLSDTGFNLSRIAEYSTNPATCKAFAAWVDEAETVFLRMLARMQEQKATQIRLTACRSH